MVSHGGRFGGVVDELAGFDMIVARANDIAGQIDALAGSPQIRHGLSHIDRSVGEMSRILAQLADRIAHSLPA